MRSSITQHPRQLCRISAVLLLLGVLVACGGPPGGPPPAPPSAEAATAPAGTITPLPEDATAADAALGLAFTPGRETEALWAALHESRGVVVLLRHARTVPGTGDPPRSQLDDCATQRNLSEEVHQAILAHRERGGVVIMVTHMVNIVEVSGVSPQQGEALVVRGTAQGSVEVLGQLLVDAGT